MPSLSPFTLLGDEIGGAPKWDWYQATIPDWDGGDVINELLMAYDESDYKTSKGINCYDHKTEVSSKGLHVCTVLHGGRNGMPNAFASSSNAIKFSKVVRELFPVHKVTRADTAIDFLGFKEQGSDFATLAERLVGFAHQDDRLKGQMVKATKEQDGSTYYLGSAKSPARLRLYEKGLEFRGMAVNEATRAFLDRHVPSNWLRAELQVRPMKEKRIEFATVSPADAWGFTRWSSQVVSMLFDLQVELMKRIPTPATDDERALEFMFRQYFNTVQRQVKKYGADYMVGCLRDGFNLY